MGFHEGVLAHQKHLPDLLDEHLVTPSVVSNVRHSSDLVDSRIWHVNSTKLLAEEKLTIFTDLSLL